MNIALNNYINEYGDNALWDTDELCDYLTNNKVDKKTVCHYDLVLSFGNLKEIVSRSGKKITSVMLNTAIINTVRNTGLKQSVVQDVFSDVFAALHISYEGETLFGYNTETGEIVSVKNQLSPPGTKKQLKKAEKLIASSDETNVKEAIQIYEELSRSGSPEAQYMLGVIKKREHNSFTKGLFNRFLTSKENKNDKEMIQHLFECSAANGYAQAKAELGDIYYEKQDFDRAYEYYAAPGVITVKQDTKEKIISILNQRIKNVWLIILGGLLLVAMWIFMFLNTNSVHNNIALFGWGIPINILVTLIYGFMCFSIQKFRYQNHKGLILVMTILWSIYPLILAIN